MVLSGAQIRQRPRHRKPAETGCRPFRRPAHLGSSAAPSPAPPRPCRRKHGAPHSSDRHIRRTGHCSRCTRDRSTPGSPAAAWRNVANSPNIWAAVPSSSRPHPRLNSVSPAEQDAAISGENVMWPDRVARGLEHVQLGGAQSDLQPPPRPPGRAAAADAHRLPRPSPARRSAHEQGRSPRRDHVVMGQQDQVEPPPGRLDRGDDRGFLGRSTWRSNPSPYSATATHSCRSKGERHALRSYRRV